MTRLRLLLPVIVCTLFTACYTSRVRIQLEADGSGTLVVTQTASQALLSYLQHTIDGPMEERLFNEDLLRAAEAQYGKGVTYLRHNVFDTEDGKAFIATYTFQDINTVKIGTQHGTGTAAALKNDGTGEFTFKLVGHDLSILAPSIPDEPGPKLPQVPMPEQSKKQEARFRQNIQTLMQHDNPFGLTGKETRSELVRTLLAGMGFRVELAVPGRVRGTNASHLEEGPLGQQIVLMDIQMDRLMKNEQFVETLTDRRDGKLSAAALLRFPGTRVESNALTRVLFDPDARVPSK